MHKKISIIFFCLIFAALIPAACDQKGGASAAPASVLLPTLTVPPAQAGPDAYLESIAPARLLVFRDALVLVSHDIGYDLGIENDIPAPPALFIDYKYLNSIDPDVRALHSAAADLVNLPADVLRATGKPSQKYTGLNGTFNLLLQSANKFIQEFETRFLQQQDLSGEADDVVDHDLRDVADLYRQAFNEYSAQGGPALPTHTPTVSPTSTLMHTMMPTPIEPVWTDLGPKGINISSLAIDPKTPTTIYAGTNMGPYKSTDSGDQWISLLSNSNPDMATEIKSLIIDPQKTNILYAVVDYTGIYKSTDGGETWVESDTGIPKTDKNKRSVHINILAIDPSYSDTVYAGTDKVGLYRSKDGGGSWTAINNGLADPNICSLAVDPRTPNILYAGGLLKTNSSHGCIPLLD